MSSQRFQTNDFLIVLEDFNSISNVGQSIECKQEKYINIPFFVIVIVLCLFRKQKSKDWPIYRSYQNSSIRDFWRDICLQSRGCSGCYLFKCLSSVISNANTIMDEQSERILILESYGNEEHHELSLQVHKPACQLVVLYHKIYQE